MLSVVSSITIDIRLFFRGFLVLCAPSNVNSESRTQKRQTDPSLVCNSRFDTAPRALFHRVVRCCDVGIVVFVVVTVWLSNTTRNFGAYKWIRTYETYTLRCPSVIFSGKGSTSCHPFCVTLFTYTLIFSVCVCLFFILYFILFHCLFSFYNSCTYFTLCES